MKFERTVVLLFLLACGSQEKLEEEYRSTEKQLDSLKQSFNLKLKDASLSLETNRKTLSDSIRAFSSTFNFKIDEINSKIEGAEQDYINEIAKIKDYYYTRYGHDYKFQDELDTKMEKAFRKKQEAVEDLNLELAKTKDKIESHPKYRVHQKAMDSLSIHYYKYSTALQSEFENKKRELELKLNRLTKEIKEN